MATPGSAGNVIAAICSFFIAGLGQLVQGRVGAALFFFLVWCLAIGILTVLTLGFLVFLAGLINIWACIDAALWKDGP
ncbi:MAG: hypothetical protein AAGK14_12035 [Verrucomicrobiota bacterium]